MSVASVCFSVFFVTVTQSLQNIMELNAIQIIERHGYPYEVHTITTKDGYILRYLRIPHGKSHTYCNKPPVLIMHGILSSAMDFINQVPERGIAYLLADKGYDVWLANARGTAGSLNHTSIDITRNPKKYFDFSWHEIGYYDVPAAIDYILALTKENNLYYVGHSQGGTVFLVMASSRPEYNNKIKAASLLAPAAFMQHMTNTMDIFFARNVKIIQTLSTYFGIYEIPFLDSLRKFFRFYCMQPFAYNDCKKIYVEIGGVINSDLIADDISGIFENYPSSGSIKQIVHFFQLIRNGGFSYYDYGHLKNKRIYDRETPPSYELSKVSAPIAIFYGGKDTIVNSTDVDTLIRNLPNVIKTKQYGEYGHLSFLLGKDVVEVVYAEIFSVMNQYL